MTTYYSPASVDITEDHHARLGVEQHRFRNAMLAGLVSAGEVAEWYEMSRAQAARVLKRFVDRGAECMVCEDCGHPINPTIGNLCPLVHVTSLPDGTLASSCPEVIYS